MKNRKNKILILHTLSLIIIITVTIHLNSSSFNFFNNNDENNKDIIVNNLKASDSTPLWSKNIGTEISSIAMSDNGFYIAVGTINPTNRVYLFNITSNRPMWYSTLMGSVSSIDISADGEYIVAGSSDKNVYLFNKSSQNPLWNYTTNGDVRSVSISDNGNNIIIGSDLPQCQIIAFKRSSSVPLWIHNENNISSVEISGNGAYIAAALGPCLRLINFSNGYEFWNYTDVANYFIDASISYDGMNLIAGGMLNITYKFNWINSTPVWNITTNAGFNDVEISSNGNYLTLGNAVPERKIYYLEAPTGGLTWSDSTGSSVEAVAISSDGTRIIAGNYGGDIFYYNLSGQVWNYHSAGDIIRDVDISANRKYLVAGGYNGILYVWNQTSEGGSDNQPPSVTTIIYDVQAECETGSIDVQATITDVSGLSSVKINFHEPDNTLIGKFPMAFIGGNKYHYSWNVGLYPSNTSYYFIINATDIYNNVNDTQKRNFNIVDTTSPSIQNINANPLTAVKGATITITARVKDFSGISTCYSRIFNGSGTVLWLTMYDDGTSGGDSVAGDDNYTCQWFTAGYGTGAYSFEINATDSSISSNTNVVICGSVITLTSTDTTPPVISNVQALPNPATKGNNITITAHITDDTGIYA
ncbi:MAG: WD40 repeat domain-containing protein, partial [Promethearchaeota archaeon]